MAEFTDLPWWCSSAERHFLLFLNDFGSGTGAKKRRPGYSRLQFFDSWISFMKLYFGGLLWSHIRRLVEKAFGGKIFFRLLTFAQGYPWPASWDYFEFRKCVDAIEIFHVPKIAFGRLKKIVGLQIWAVGSWVLSYRLVSTTSSAASLNEECQSVPFVRLPQPVFLLLQKLRILSEVSSMWIYNLLYFAGFYCVPIVCFDG